jgi:dihydrodipicolinate synthase/N-acetylneuraminate lyase
MKGRPVTVTADAIRGVVLPLPTVFDREGEPDERAMRAMTEFYVGTGVNSLFLLGSYGMGPALDIAQRERVAAAVIDQARARVPVIVHVGAVDPYTAVRLGKHAKAAGADAVALVGPYYYRDKTVEEIILHFEMVDRELRMPLFIYNNPEYQGYAIDIELYGRLLERAPGIFGAKLSQSPLPQALEYVRAFPSQRFFVVGSGMMPGMTQGIRGFISPALSLVPELAVALVKAIDAGDLDRANVLSERAADTTKFVVSMWKRHGRAPYAEGLRLLGLQFEQYPRWPTPQLPEEDRAELVRVLRQARTVDPVPATR